VILKVMMNDFNSIKESINQKQFKFFFPKRLKFKEIVLSERFDSFYLASMLFNGLEFFKNLARHGQ